MLSQILRDARKYEETMERGIDGRLRPGFHLSARVGWMNDPNGFSFYKGEYHLFYQYHPYNCQWGPMHWGHAVSTDLLHWRYLPVALAPETDYDRDGCFSGSAAVLSDGSHLLMYTGVSKETQPDGSTCDVQKQCIAIGDGIDYEKYTGNPVLDQKDLPECGSRFDFRDPKIWQKQDGSYRCVAGNCTEEKDGQILLYSSPDGFHWKYEKILASNRERFGRMWECPDFFALDGKQVLLISPQDMLPQGFEYHNGNGTVCLTGSYNEETEEFTEEADQAVDYGIDFYAPQTDHDWLDAELGYVQPSCPERTALVWADESSEGAFHKRRPAHTDTCQGTGKAARDAGKARECHIQRHYRTCWRLGTEN